MSRRLLALVLGLAFGGGVSLLSCSDDGPLGTGVAISVEPSMAEAVVNESVQFMASVVGIEDEHVTWAVREGKTHGTISQDGLYLAPSSQAFPVTATIVATSKRDTTVAGTATVVIRMISMATVPNGTFTMGPGGPFCGRNEYPVTLTEDFYFSQMEVTNQQYLELLQWAFDQGYVTATVVSVNDAMGSSEELIALGDQDCEIAFSGETFILRDAGHGLNPSHPVKEVSWYGAASYCDWLSLKEGLKPAYDHSTWQCNGRDPYRAQGYRLPTDAEWGYVAQYDDKRLYPWGTEPLSCDRANYYGCPGSWTQPVGTQAAGPEKTIGGRELYDMAGNVLEWCNDWWQCEADPSPTDPPGPPDGSDRLFRGGSWNTLEDLTRCAHRHFYGISPGSSHANLGFRIARTVNP